MTDKVTYVISCLICWELAGLQMGNEPWSCDDSKGPFMNTYAILWLGTILCASEMNYLYQYPGDV